MRFTRNDKCARVLRLLIGLRNPRIGSSLASSGMTLADVEEGWSLLRALGPSRLEPAPEPWSPRAELAKLRAWEIRWFQVASASLARRFPLVHERLFLNLPSVPGAEAILAVGYFVERWDDMRAARTPFGTDGPRATDLLASRGLTGAVIDEARALIASHIVQPPAPSGSVEQTDQAELASAEDALWAWYLEWSRLARLAIRDRVLLRQLGFAG